MATIQLIDATTLYCYVSQQQNGLKANLTLLAAPR